MIPGMTVNLKSDSSSAVQLSVARSKSDIKASLESVINSMNAFRDELDRLTFIDVDGENNGPLSNDTAVKMMQSNFKKLMIEPLTGYSSNNIYLSQLGIKTNASGSLYLDTPQLLIVHIWQIPNILTQLKMKTYRQALLMQLRPCHNSVL